MSSGSQNDCPLCMEPFELDDINFFPCTCGYQICRFCWHRIRTDENGLCPACRRSYTESPAEFKPLADTDLQKLKKEKRQKESQKKQKAAENRSHLASVRVVQKNLVFVVGLAHRLADVEVLKRSEYFGRFGKIHKIVINQSTSYAGAQGPSASAYVTFYRSEDAIRAIQAINNVTVDGRTIKASLGTTKYCTFFLRGLSCTKADCMYLHELGDELGSFTKEQMQQGKHLEYEQMLYDECNQNIRSSTTTSSVPQSSSSHQQSSHNQHIKTQTTRPVGSSQKKFPSSVRHQNSRHSGAVQSTKGWSSRNSSEARANCRNLTKGDSIENELQSETGIADKCLHSDGINSQSNASTNCRNSSSLGNSPTTSPVDTEVKLDFPLTGTTPLLVTPFPALSQAVPSFETAKSSAAFQTDREILPKEICIPNHLTSDLTQQPNKSDSREDDLEFDPWNESTKGLADMMEKENNFFDNKSNIFNPPYPLNNLLDRQNRTLTLKQLSVANGNEGLSPTHSSWPPTSSAPSPEYQLWQNNVHLLRTKPKPNCDVATAQVDRRLASAGDDFPLRIYQNCERISEKGWSSHPGEYLWTPPVLIGPNNGQTVPQWHSLLHPISGNNFLGFHRGLQMHFGVPFGVISNLQQQAEVHPAPPGFCSVVPSVPAHLEPQGTLADSVD